MTAVNGCSVSKSWLSPFCLAPALGHQMPLVTGWCIRWARACIWSPDAPSSKWMPLVTGWCIRWPNTCHYCIGCSKNVFLFFCLFRLLFTFDYHTFCNLFKVRRLVITCINHDIVVGLCFELLPYDAYE